MDPKGHNKETRAIRAQGNGAHFDTFVLDKGIFSNVFEKDIRRVYIYKKAERLAKAIHLITPAFRQSPALRDRVDSIAMGLVDGATLAPALAREALSRELLALSSLLAIARTGGLLSAMNADLIAHEAHLLLQEVASYEEPRLAMEEAPTLAALAKAAPDQHAYQEERVQGIVSVPSAQRLAKAEEGGAKGHPDPSKGHKGHIQQPRATRPEKPGRREAILSVLRAKGPSYIKDISTVIRDVSEKTIQRELLVLVQEGSVTKSGERRWTNYTISS